MLTTLLVEDNEMKRDMLRRRLDPKAYIVTIAEDGQQPVGPPATLAAANPSSCLGGWGRLEALPNG